MAKVKTQYGCSECGAVSPKWAGQCTECLAWNTLVEQKPVENKPTRGGRFAGYAGVDAGDVADLSSVGAEDDPRHATGLDELDRVLGGGLVTGSVVLIGGDPGIGKSTLLLQVMAKMAGRVDALYVSGEESLKQLALRARRLGLTEQGIRSVAETQVERILATAHAEQPKVLVVDSIQTLYTETLQSAPGAVAQVRECAAALVRYAKASGTAVFLVGHVTKEGGIAGPRVLEHMVDAVLYFEGESGGRYRILRALKNRFGAVNELGVFAMTGAGLKGVSNPSAIFLSGSREAVPGSVVMVTREGTRPMLAEIQALVDSSHLANPRRLAVGMDQQRLAMLLAVLHRSGGMMVADQDVFVNAVGGLRISETASDLALIMAVASSLSERALPRDWVVFGEVGLAGEVRPVFNGEERLREAAKQGFKTGIVPAGNAGKGVKIDGMDLKPVRRMEDAIQILKNA